MGISSGLPVHHNNITEASPPPPPPPRNGTHNPHKPFSLFMPFYWILFSDWPGNSKGMYALALIFVFLLAVLEQLLANINLVKPGSKRACPVVSQMGIQGVRAGLAYLVMLAVMSYNGGVFIVAVVGQAVGYVVFGSPVFKKRSNSNIN